MRTTNEDLMLGHGLIELGLTMATIWWDFKEIMRNATLPKKFFEICSPNDVSQFYKMMTHFPKKLIT